MRCHGAPLRTCSVPQRVSYRVKRVRADRTRRAAMGPKIPETTPTPGAVLGCCVPCAGGWQRVPARCARMARAAVVIDLTHLPSEDDAHVFSPPPRERPRRTPRAAGDDEVQLIEPDPGAAGAAGAAAPRARSGGDDAVRGPRAHVRGAPAGSNSDVREVDPPPVAAGTVLLGADGDGDGDVRVVGASGHVRPCGGAGPARGARRSPRAGAGAAGGLPAPALRVRGAPVQLHAARVALRQGTNMRPAFCVVLLLCRPGLAALRRALTRPRCVVLLLRVRRAGARVRQVGPAALQRRAKQEVGGAPQPAPAPRRAPPSCGRSCEKAAAPAALAGLAPPAAGGEQLVSIVGVVGAAAGAGDCSCGARQEPTGALGAAENRGGAHGGARAAGGGGEWRDMRSQRGGGLLG